QRQEPIVAQMYPLERVQERMLRVIRIFQVAKIGIVKRVRIGRLRRKRKMGRTFAPVVRRQIQDRVIARTARPKEKEPRPREWKPKRRNRRPGEVFPARAPGQPAELLARGLVARTDWRAGGAGHFRRGYCGCWLSGRRLRGLAKTDAGGSDDKREEG